MSALALWLLIALAVSLGTTLATRGRAEKWLLAHSAPLSDAELTPRLRALAEALGYRQLSLRVLDMAEINGLAAPDGRIYLTRGFMERYAQGAVSADELASVAAHELGHVALGHTKLRMREVAGQNFLLLALQLVLARFLPFIGPWLAAVAAQGLAARRSQAREYEADAFAAALLVKAGIGTGPQKSLLAKLGRLIGSAAPRPPAWLSSHPATEERIARIAALEAAWGVAGAPAPPPTPRGPWG